MRWEGSSRTAPFPCESTPPVAITVVSVVRAETVGVGVGVGAGSYDLIWNFSAAVTLNGWGGQCSAVAERCRWDGMVAVAGGVCAGVGDIHRRQL